MAKTAIGYVRVSTEGQATEGVSLDAQQAKIQAWCLANDVELGNVFIDAGLSGSRADNRPQLQAALDEVCRTGGVLIVYSLSRLARSTKDTIAISERLDRASADVFHDLRHTQASLMLAAGVDLKVIQKRLGHRDFATTANIYSHLLQGAENDAVLKVDALMSRRAEKVAEQPAA